MQESSSGFSSVDRIAGADFSVPADAHAINLPWGPDATLGLELPPGLLESELEMCWPTLHELIVRLSGCPGGRARWPPGIAAPGVPGASGLDRGSRG